MFLNRSPCHDPPYLSRWRTDSSISHENELAFPAISFPHLRRLVVSAGRERNGRGRVLRFRKEGRKSIRGKVESGKRRCGSAKDGRGKDRRVGWQGDERGKSTGRMKDGMLENAHANGRGFTAKVSRGNERNVRSTGEQTNPSIDRSGTGGSFPSPSFFSFSFSLPLPR